MKMKEMKMKNNKWNEILMKWKLMKMNDNEMMNNNE